MCGIVLVREVLGRGPDGTLRLVLSRRFFWRSGGGGREALPGCPRPSLRVGLARYPGFVALADAVRFKLECRARRECPYRVSTGGLGKAFCKTQYASNISMGHFLRCHATVCALLREARKLGCRVEVRDEGGFWGKWDYDALAREVGGWNRMLAGFVRAIESVLGGAGMSAESPIVGNAPTMKLGALSRKSPGSWPSWRAGFERF